MKTIDTTRFSGELRSRSIDVSAKKLLVTNYFGTEQEQDLTLPPNCRGFGRVRHFHRATSNGWPSNPLPIDPAAEALGTASDNILKAQVFQNAACNWRCWYCYVPFNLLNANLNHSTWLSASDLIDLFLGEEDRPEVIDLSGGQPDLVPEWVPWMMSELQDRGLDDEVYLWSDDNLSNDYFWRYLTDDERAQVSSYRNYGKVCCFKGFDCASFAFNTNAAPELFENQLDLFQRYVNLGIDIYGYATFTSATLPHADSMKRFVDLLQSIHVNAPLRIIPLEVRSFSPVSRRLSEHHKNAMLNQQTAITLWQDELEHRFSSELRSRSITKIPLDGHGVAT